MIDIISKEYKAERHETNVKAAMELASFLVEKRLPASELDKVFEGSLFSPFRTDDVKSIP